MRLIERLKYELLPSIGFVIQRLNRLPTSITIEPTNYCNYDCVFCLRRKMTRKVGNMTALQFSNIIDQIPTLEKVSFYFMGEPLMNPELFDMIRYAESRNIKTVVATNSSLLRKNYRQIIDSGLSLLIISLDGMSQEALEKYRRHSHLEAILEGIRLVCQEKRTLQRDKPFTKIRYLVFKHNETEIPTAIEFAREARVDQFVLVRAILDWGGSSVTADTLSEWLPEDERYQRYVAGGLRQPLPYCTWIWTPLITWNGDVIPCCYDADAEYALGNVFERPFPDIYWSREYAKMRKRMKAMTLPLCETCKQVEGPEIEVRLNER